MEEEKTKKSYKNFEANIKSSDNLLTGRYITNFETRDMEGRGEERQFKRIFANAPENMIVRGRREEERE
jgi:hypothetical protein